MSVKPKKWSDTYTSNEWCWEAHPPQAPMQSLKILAE